MNEHIPIHERILQSRGHTPTGGGEARNAAYAAFQDSGGHPQTGFALHLRGGSVHLFQYSHIDNAEFRKEPKREYVWLTHRGKSVVLAGRNLLPLMEKIQDYTLKALYEYDETLGYFDDQPMIDRANVKNINLEIDMES